VLRIRFYCAEICGKVTICHVASCQFSSWQDHSYAVLTCCASTLFIFSDMCLLWARQISLSGCSVFVFAGMHCQFMEEPWHHSHQQCWSLQSAFGYCFRPHDCMQVTTSEGRPSLSRLLEYGDFTDSGYQRCGLKFYFGYVWKCEVFTSASDLFNGISIII
jgi:hypothetical protein